jgi:MazG family protein
VSLADALLELQRLTERLRRECPWDREQTALTIVPHTVEEAYEVADAATSGSPEALLDELGDLLFQVYFLALLLEERGHGGLEDVAWGVHAKLVRRHPHVFGSEPLETAAAVRGRWEQIKATEGRKSLFAGIPGSLPALMQARKVQRRAASAGFEYPDVAGALADLQSELAELEHEIDARGVPAPESPPDERQAAELGDLLFACVNVARRLNVDPELELRRASARFTGRVEKAAELAAGTGAEFASLPLAEQDRFYERAKAAE